MPRRGGRRGAARPARQRDGGGAGRLDLFGRRRQFTVRGHRVQIDRLDLQILKLINERADLAAKIGKVKTENNDSVFSPAREEEVLGNIQRSNGGPLESVALRRLFERIIDESRWIERHATDRSAAPGAPRGSLSGPGRTDDAQD